jgi:hypothetical protein
MTKVLSLKIKGETFEGVEAQTKRLHMPRNTYINEALDFYNAYNRRKGLRQKLQKESRLTRKDSMEILGEMEKLEEASAE